MYPPINAQGVMPPPAVPSKPVIPPEAIKREPLSAFTNGDKKVREVTSALSFIEPNSVIAVLGLDYHSVIRVL